MLYPLFNLKDLCHVVMDTLSLTPFENCESWREFDIHRATIWQVFEGEKMLAQRNRIPKEKGNLGGKWLPPE